MRSVFEFRRAFRTALVCFFSTMAATTAGAADAEWPQFLGPKRDGISAETGLIDQWPVGGPKVVWRQPGGVGMSGLAISRRRLLTLVQNGGRQQAVCLDAKTAAPLWRTALASAYRNPQGDGPRGTPTIVGETAFVFTGDGTLAALRLADGAILWSHSTIEDLKGKEAEYGMTCSPLVVGGQVIVSVGAPAAAVAAFDAGSGKRLWTAGDDAIGYSSPMLLNVGGRPQLVACTANSVIGLAPTSGGELWRHPFVTDFGCNTAAPIAVDGGVFVSAGENHGSTLLSLTPQGEKIEVAERWSSLGPKSVLRSEWQTPILLDGFIYGMDNVGGAGPITHLTCIKASTGERVWKKDRFGKGNLIAADGKLFISTMEGELAVVLATSRGFEELGRAVVLGPTRQAPALAGGLIYIRDDKEIVCLDVRKP